MLSAAPGASHNAVCVAAMQKQCGVGMLAQQQIHHDSPNPCEAVKERRCQYMFMSGGCGLRLVWLVVFCLRVRLFSTPFNCFHSLFSPTFSYLLILGTKSYLVGFGKDCNLV